MEKRSEEKSFSIGRLDIVDLYEWHTNGKLVYETYFQRQFVWKEKDKKDLIDTIMKGYPIPAIFICDAKTNYTTLSKTSDQEISDKAIELKTDIEKVREQIQNIE